MTSYPQGTKMNPAVGRQHSLIADLAVAAMPGTSSRSTAATSGRGDGRGSRLKPQSVTWADGLFRHTGNLLGKFQLTPKASSFSGGGQASRGAPMTFEKQMCAVRVSGGSMAASNSRPSTASRGLYPAPTT
uniref:Uncharacterized protein n=1 Tax=Zooxanthella nutricula TaxID=1333877 RepID=A0A7S2LYP7_9DINO